MFDLEGAQFHMGFAPFDALIEIARMLYWPSDDSLPVRELVYAADRLERMSQVGAAQELLSLRASDSERTPVIN